MKTVMTMLCAGLLAGLLTLGGTSAHANQPSGFDVASLGLDASRCANKRTLGKVKIRGVISDGDHGNLVNDLLTNTTTVRVKDAGEFDVEVTLSNCQSVSDGKVSCIGQSQGRRVKAFVRQFRDYADVYVFSMRVKDVPVSETGGPAITAPVEVTIVHGSRERKDEIAEVNAQECRSKKNGCTLRCRSRN